MYRDPQEPTLEHALQTPHQPIASPPVQETPDRALENAFRDYRTLLYHAAFRVTGNAADAEDALQTVFLRLARRADGIGAAEASPGYLCRAAVNAALDVLRAKKRQGAAGITEHREGDGAAEVSDPEPRADERLRVRELRAALRRALVTLHPRAAEAFVLRSFEGWTNPEIARLFGTSQAVIAVTVFRARRRLRRELGPLVNRIDTQPDASV